MPKYGTQMNDELWATKQSVSMQKQKKKQKPIKLLAFKFHGLAL